MARPPSKRALRKVFDRCNSEHFGGVLPPVDLETTLEHEYGSFCPPCGEHPFGVIYVNTRLTAQLLCGWRGVLLHELIHAYLFFMSPEVDELDADEVAYHGPVFAAEANRIGATLGLPRVDESSSWAWPWCCDEEEEPEPSGEGLDE